MQACRGLRRQQGPARAAAWTQRDERLHEHASLRQPPHRAAARPQPVSATAQWSLPDPSNLLPEASVSSCLCTPRYDARLTKAGRAQAAALAAAVAALRPSPQLVLVSPLTRCLETATLALTALTSAISGSEQLSIVAEPLLREKVILSSEIGRSAAVLSSEFPNIDFSRLDGQATWWFTNGGVDNICPGEEGAGTAAGSDRGVAAQPRSMDAAVVREPEGKPQSPRLLDICTAARMCQHGCDCLGRHVLVCKLTACCLLPRGAVTLHATCSYISGAPAAVAEGTCGQARIFHPASFTPRRHQALDWPGPDALPVGHNGGVGTRCYCCSRWCQLSISMLTV